MRQTSLIHQGETTHAYIFDLFPDGEPATENCEARELTWGCEPSSQGDGAPLAEPADNDPIRREILSDLLRNQHVHLIPRPEDPSFVFWTFEPKTKDIKPKTTS